MSSSEQNQAAARGGTFDFHTTQWTTVLKACENRAPEAAAALERLCRAYWCPLYAFVRREGYSPEEAQDLTQDFFRHLVQHKALASVDRAKGKFRSFLLASLKNFLINEWNRQRTQKRGGAARIFSLDEEEAEERYLSGLVDKATPERLYEQRWAQTILDRVFEELRGEHEQAGKGERFELLQPYLLDDPEASRYAEVADKLHLTESGVASAVQRLRQRFGALFRAEIAKTVASPDEIDDQIRYLIGQLRLSK